MSVSGDSLSGVRASDEETANSLGVTFMVSAEKCFAVKDGNGLNRSHIRSCLGGRRSGNSRLVSRLFDECSWHPNAELQLLAGQRCYSQPLTHTHLPSEGR